jgi:hypothetical protein
MGRRIDEVLIAQFHLRSGRTSLKAQIYWPRRPLLPEATSLMVMLADEAKPGNAELLAGGLSARADVVVLRVPDRVQSPAALIWAADHAHELGGQADRVMVAGRGISGAQAARLAIMARDNGWPILQRPYFSGRCWCTRGSPSPAHLRSASLERPPRRSSPGAVHRTKPCATPPS